MAEGTARQIYFHQFDAAGVEIDDLRILNQSGRNRVKQADLGEQAQRFGVIGDGARQADRAVVALDDRDIDAGGSKQIGQHQPDRAGANNRHITL